MRKLFEHITANRKKIITAFVILAVFCALCKQLVIVNYDMNDYLPEDCPSSISLDVMAEEFDGDIPNARVMVSNVTIADALDYKKKIKSVDGVTDVKWLDDVCDIYRPLEIQSSKTADTYYSDNSALFTVTISEDKTISAVSAIREIIGSENAMTGSAVSTALATQSTVSEISKISLIAVFAILAILILTTGSFAEPFIILAGLGIAIIINSGSNLIFGTVSFVTNSAGTILQLAVSLDYCVFLLHRFEECSGTEKDPSSAMVSALTSSVSSIFSSGLTTVIGFAALCLMRFGIGPDLGLALAKGIAISLLTVFVFVPGLTLCLHPLIKKTQHRPFLPPFNRFSRLVSRLMICFACIFALAVVPAYLASNSNSFYYGASHIFEAGTQYGDDTEKIENIFGENDTYILMVPVGSTATETALSNELQSLDAVSSVISFVDSAGAEIPKEYLDFETLSLLESGNYSRMVISVNADFEGTKTFALIDSIRAIADSYYPGETYLAGQGVSTYDLMDTVTADTAKVNLIAIAAVFVVLLLMMKSISLPIILVTAIEAAIWINLSIPYFTDSPVFYIAYLIISSVQLGATVDYAILFTDRYCEFRQKLSKIEAVQKTVSSVTVSILVSASAMTIIGFLLGWISSHKLLSQLGFFLGKGTICSLVIVLFVLPGLLYIFDTAIQKTSRGLKFFRKENQI